MILSHFKSYYLIRLHLVPFYFISVLEVGNGFVEVIATSGDSHLGVCVRERVCERERERECESEVCESEVCMGESGRELFVCVCMEEQQRERAVCLRASPLMHLSPLKSSIISCF